MARDYKKGSSFWICILFFIISKTQSQTTSENNGSKDTVKDVHVSCNSEDISVTITTFGESFNGLIYPKGLSKNSSCMSEYKQAAGESIQYLLPLRLCNTMNIPVADGIEYFNTIIVQPHLKLVTHQGRGYHIRCRYQTEERTLQTDFHVDFQPLIPLTATAAMPGATMRIYDGEPLDGRIAESVKIGDLLSLVIAIDTQEIYGMHVSECLVMDGLGWSQQPLINNEGCPLDPEIFGPFVYGQTKTTALVHFQAHKFPHTSSVYYQCNVRLCIRHAGGCDDVPPVCDGSIRKRRQTVELDESQGGALYDTNREDLKVKVYSGLHVNEAGPSEDDLEDNSLELRKKVYDLTKICIPQRDFAIGIAITGLILMGGVVAVILILITRRRRKRNLASAAGSSIFSEHYPTTIFSSRSI